MNAFKNMQYFLLLMSLTLQNNCMSTSINDYQNHINTPVTNLEQLAAKFPKSADEIIKQTDLSLQLAKYSIDQIIAIPACDRTFENIAVAYDQTMYNLGQFISIVNILGSVSPDQAIQDQANTSSVQLQQCIIDLKATPLLYTTIAEFNASIDHAALSDEDAKLLDAIILDFHVQGFDLPTDQFKHVQELQKDLIKLETTYQQNITADSSFMTCSKQELDGVDDLFLTKLQHDDHEDLYTITPTAPNYLEIMQTCKNAATRKKMFLLFRQIAYPSNNDVLTSILQVRNQLAIELGYPDFATSSLVDTMAQNTDNVLNFLNNIITRVASKQKDDLALLTSDISSNVTLQEDGAINPWDIAYLIEQYTKQLFNINQKEIAEYFPIQKVIQATFDIYQNFLGLTFKEVVPLWSWHKDVQLIEISRTSDQEFLGYLFLDLHPRANKTKHIAFCCPIIISCQKNSYQQPSVIGIFTNFPQPTDTKPALLSHDHVIIFFHEFGHAMHALLSRTKHGYCAGINVKADFVEVPSQMFEQWMLNPEIIKQASCHYQTQQPLPTDILQNVITANNCFSSFMITRQCMMSLFALQMSQQPFLNIDIATQWKTLHQQYQNGIIAYEPNNYFYNSWIHLSDSNLYSTKYYGYLWTKVLAMDLFNEIEQHTFNSEYSSKVQTMLSAGGSIDPNTLLHNFLNREPNSDAFLKYYNL